MLTFPRLVALVLAATVVVGALTILVAAPPAAAQSTTKVTIQNFAFSPNSITVVIGVNNSVTWTNMDSTAHTVTADGGAFNSGSLSTGQTFSFTFTTAGSYTYHCSIHPYMTGTVIVKAGGSPTSSSGGIPEFPFEGALVVAITFAVVASYIAVRRARRA